jgi:glycerophosphoryl diester phosphodiesterase
LFDTADTGILLLVMASSTIFSSLKHVVVPASLLLLASGSAFGAGFAFFEPQRPPRPFHALVHRGESRQAPENTHSALQRCIDDGLEWAEIDLRLTKDGQYILSHDDTVADGAGKSWRIADSTLAELSEVEVGSKFAKRYEGEKLLPLTECFKLCRGRLNLYLDAKSIQPDSLVKAILAAGMEKQVVVYDDLESLRRIREASADKIATMTKWRPALGGPEWAVKERLAAVEIDAPEVTAEVLRGFKSVDVKVEVKVLGKWDEPEMWDRIIAAGADWAQTDLPEELMFRAEWVPLKHKPVQISLHRGANRYAPENTLPAFAKAIRMGVDFVEFDVRTTRDGAFYLLHDSRLDRTTGQAGGIDQFTAETVRNLSAGAKFGLRYADVKVPSLDEFLTLTAGKVGLYFDAKVIPPEALAVAIRRCGMTDRTVVYQSPDYLSRLHAIEPRIRGLAPLQRTEDFPKLARELKPYAVDSEWDILSKDMIAQCHAAGVRVFSDALGKHERVEDYLRAMDWGIDLIQTDNPLRLLRAVELRLAGVAKTAP